MAVVVRADNIPYADRDEFWRSTFEAYMPGLDLYPRTLPDSDDHIVAGDLGVLNVIEHVSGPGRSASAPGEVPDDASRFHVVAVVDGVAVGEHNGRQGFMHAGDLGLVDLAKPFGCVHGTNRSVFMTFPAEATALTADQLGELAGIRIEGRSGLPGLVASLIADLPRRLDHTDGTDPVRFGTAVLDLLTAVLMSRLDGDAGPSTTPDALRLRVLAHIEANLADPDLSPSTVAAAVHVSVRYLHRLFEGETAGVAAMIRRRRLERCRRDLLDPAMRAVPVAAIGARWGFLDPAGFSRAFRAHFAMPPGAYRRLAIA